MSGEKCETCSGKMYLEVTMQDSREYIQACDNCFYIGYDLDGQACILAENDGYKLGENGLILD